MQCNFLSGPKKDSLRDKCLGIIFHKYWGFPCVLQNFNCFNAWLTSLSVHRARISVIPTRHVIGEPIKQSAKLSGDLIKNTGKTGMWHCYAGRASFEASG